MQATAEHRGTTEQIANITGILQDIKESTILQAMWEKYRKQFAYAKDISYDMVMTTLNNLCEMFFQ